METGLDVVRRLRAPLQVEEQVCRFAYRAEQHQQLQRVAYALRRDLRQHSAHERLAPRLAVGRVPAGLHA